MKFSKNLLIIYLKNIQIIFNGMVVKTKIQIIKMAADKYHRHFLILD